MTIIPGRSVAYLRRLMIAMTTTVIFPLYIAPYLFSLDHIPDFDGFGDESCERTVYYRDLGVYGYFKRNLFSILLFLVDIMAAGVWSMRFSYEYNHERPSFSQAVH
jgi:hypothetical protein